MREKADLTAEKDEYKNRLNNLVDVTLKNQ
jgi:hypothetical protein